MEILILIIVWAQNVTWKFKIKVSLLVSECTPLFYLVCNEGLGFCILKMAILFVHDLLEIIVLL